ncbi:MAG: hypothetical protein AAFY36_15120, partial [Bacteroidota bacterium]
MIWAVCCVLISCGKNKESLQSEKPVAKGKSTFVNSVGDTLETAVHRLAEWRTRSELREATNSNQLVGWDSTEIFAPISNLQDHFQSETLLNDLPYRTPGKNTWAAPVVTKAIFKEVVAGPPKKIRVPAFLHQSGTVFPIKQLSINNFFPLSFINIKHKDSHGDYWIRFAEGLGRYDGEYLYLYTTEEGLIDNQIQSIEEDEEGQLYFISNNGFVIFDGYRFKQYSYELGFPIRMMISSEIDAYGNLWLGSRLTGAIRFDGTN